MYVLPSPVFLVVILHQGPHPARKGVGAGGGGGSKIQMKILALLPPPRGRGAGSLSSNLPGVAGGSPFNPIPTAKVPGPCGWGPGRKPLPARRGLGQQRREHFESPGTRQPALPCEEGGPVGTLAAGGRHRPSSLLPLTRAGVGLRKGLLRFYPYYLL